MENSRQILNPIVEEIKRFSETGWLPKQTPHLKIAKLYRRFFEKAKGLYPPDSVTREFSRLFGKSDPWARPYAVLSTISEEVEEKIGTPEGMLQAPLPEIVDVLKSDKRDWLLNRVTAESDFRQLLKEFWKHYYGYQEKDTTPNEVASASNASVQQSKARPKPKTKPDAPAPTQRLPFRTTITPIPVPLLSKLETEQERVLAMRDFFQLKSCRPEPKKEAPPKEQPREWRGDRDIIRGRRYAGTDAATEEPD